VTTAAPRPPRILVSGLRSTGKSSLVAALWGDSELLPTAVRDCTQTNTLVRAPASGEADRRIVLRYLDREAALDYASRDLAYHRLEEVVREAAGLLGTRLDELSAGDRVRWAAATVRRLFAERPGVHVLHEPAMDHVEKLEQFLAFIDSSDYRPGGAVEAPWAERHEHLMGRLRADGRTLDAGRLLALSLVELVRRTERWGPQCSNSEIRTGLAEAAGAPRPGCPAQRVAPGSPSSASDLLAVSLPDTARRPSLTSDRRAQPTPYEFQNGSTLPPELVDSPWIPTFHNARRADLILRESERADVLVIVALPEPFALEPWVEEAFRRRPELVRRTVLVFNQVDTVDLPALWSRGGFAEAWRTNVEALVRRGLDPENVGLCAAARLPFLEGLAGRTTSDAHEADRHSRIEKLRSVLAKIRRSLEGRPAGGAFTARLAAACDPADAGVETLRRRLVELTGA
jgi:hypothetical protein